MLDVESFLAGAEPDVRAALRASLSDLDWSWVRNEC